MTEIQRFFNISANLTYGRSDTDGKNETMRMIKRGIELIAIYAELGGGVPQRAREQGDVSTLPDCMPMPTRFPGSWLRTHKIVLQNITVRQKRYR